LGGGADTVHGTAIAVGDKAALIVGPSGSGKSDLALRCLSLPASELLPNTVRLVADDRVHIVKSQAAPRVVAPDTIRGKLEVRGLGIVEVPHVAEADLVLIAELVTPQAVERLPDPQPQRAILGYDLPVLRLAPFEASAPLKLVLALGQAGRGAHKPSET
jgi:HPr kinase/phosphorylase